MVQLTIEAITRTECRGCGRRFDFVKAKRGRYRYLCDSCREERRIARKKKETIARFQRISDEREGVLRVMGAKCGVCGKPKKRLELHHKIYEADSVDTKEYRQNRTKGWIGILREARAHPERFALLCNSCHKFVTWIEREPEILARLNELTGFDSRNETLGVKTT